MLQKSNNARKFAIKFYKLFRLVWTLCTAFFTKLESALIIGHRQPEWNFAINDPGLNYSPIFARKLTCIKPDYSVKQFFPLR